MVEALTVMVGTRSTSNLLNLELDARQARDVKQALLGRQPKIFPILPLFSVVVFLILFLTLSFVRSILFILMFLALQTPSEV